MGNLILSMHNFQNFHTDYQKVCRLYNGIYNHLFSDFQPSQYLHESESSDLLVIDKILHKGGTQGCKNAFSLG
jgi:hypothetical protein